MKSSEELPLLTTVLLQIALNQVNKLKLSYPDRDDLTWTYLTAASDFLAAALLRETTRG